jgi:hypothetical protein
MLALPRWMRGALRTHCVVRAGFRIAPKWRIVFFPLEMRLRQASASHYYD